DRVCRRTTIRSVTDPEALVATALRIFARLEAGAERSVEISFAFDLDDRKRHAAIGFRSAVAPATAAAGRAYLECEIETSTEQFNVWLDRSRADLNMLLSRTQDGLYPHAGVPWFATPFGRDGIITALECLWLAPDIARGVLSFLTKTQ